MKRHVQEFGVKPWAGQDLLDLQAEPFKAIDAFFAEYGNCIIKGCEVTPAGNLFNVAPGLVALAGSDNENTATFKTVPFAGAEAVTLPLYLTLTHTVVTRPYADKKVRPIAYDYRATATTVQPTDAPFLEITATGARRFADALKVTEKLDKTGNGRDVTVTFSEAGERVNITSGEKLSGLFGKIARWLSSLKTVAFTGKYSDLSGTPASLPANGGNADTVGGLNASSLISCSKTDVISGFLVKTSIPVATNAMFVFQLTYNSYGSTSVPANIILQGYNHNVSNSITEISAISTTEVPDLKLFIKDGLLHLWCNRLGDYTTLNATCQYTRFGISSTPVPGNAVVEITDAAMPLSGITRLMSVAAKIIWNTANFDPASKADLKRIYNSGLLQRDADYNNYIQSGTYGIETSNYRNTAINYPPGFQNMYGTLIVATHDIYILQTVYDIDGRMFIRTRTGAGSFTAWQRILRNNGDAKDLTVSYAQSPDRVNLVPGETIALAFGKIKKWFADLKTVAFTGDYNDLVNRPDANHNHDTVYAPKAHTHNYEPVFSKNTAFNKNFGTTAGTVAQGNHTHAGMMIAKIVGEVDHTGLKLNNWGVAFNCVKGGTSTYTVTYGDISNSFIMVTAGKGSDGSHTYASLMSKSYSGFVVTTADDITGLAAGFHFVVYTLS